MCVCVCACACVRACVEFKDEKIINLKNVDAFHVVFEQLTKNELQLNQP